MKKVQNLNIGEKIRNKRKELNLTMLEVAEKTGVSEATVSRWESGDIANMRRDKIVSLASALQVSPSYLMEWENDSEVSPAAATSDEALMFALWGNDNKDITPEMIADVRKFAQFIRETKKDEANDNN